MESLAFVFDGAKIWDSIQDDFKLKGYNELSLLVFSICL